VIKKTRCPFAITELLVEWGGNSTGKHKDYIDLCVFWVPVAPGSSLGACLCGGWRRGWVVTQIDNGCTVCMRMVMAAWVCDGDRPPVGGQLDKYERERDHGGRDVGDTEVK